MSAQPPTRSSRPQVRLPALERRDLPGEPVRVLDAWIDVAHGGRCACCLTPGRVLCAGCRWALPVAGRPVLPDPVPPGLAPAYAAGWYDAPLRPLLLVHKERRAFALAHPLGAVLAGVVRSAVGGDSRAEEVRLALVPVPSSRAVVRVRGHDPVRRMVRAAAAALRECGYDALPIPLLRQRGAVRDQAGLDAGERAANLAGLLTVDLRAHRQLARVRRPTLVVLCDDVITTGSTVREAQRALADVGIGVAVIATVAATRKRLPTVLDRT